MADGIKLEELAREIKENPPQRVEYTAIPSSQVYVFTFSMPHITDMNLLKRRFFEGERASINYCLFFTSKNLGGFFYFTAKEHQSTLKEMYTAFFDRHVRPQVRELELLSKKSAEENK